MFKCKIDDETELSLFELRHAEELNALVTENFEHIRRWSAWLTVSASASSASVGKGRFSSTKTVPSFEQYRKSSPKTDLH